MFFDDFDRIFKFVVVWNTLSPDFSINSSFHIYIFLFILYIIYVYTVYWNIMCILIDIFHKQ